MRRAVLAMVVIAGATVPALVAAVWLFGCCVLPFHGVMHRLLPLCRLAAAPADPGHEPASVPAAKPQRIVHRMLPAPGVTVIPSNPPRARLVTASPAAYRSAIALGALRCDDDVGLHTLLATFVI